MERQWMTLDQIKVEYASNDYNPELLLQHLLHHVEASPASVPAGWEVSSDEDQEAIRESENAGDGGKLFLTTVDGAHSCSIWCWGDTQDIADEQAQTIERLSAAPTPPVSEDRWLPIETAPKDGTRIIVVSETGNVWCGVYWEKRPRAGERWTSFIGPLRFDPTHWMPLPKAPAKEGK